MCNATKVIEKFRDVYIDITNITNEVNEPAVLRRIIDLQSDILDLFGDEYKRGYQDCLKDCLLEVGGINA